VRIHAIGVMIQCLITLNDTTALGYATMYTNVSGSGNVGLGINTLYENVSVSSNIATQAQVMLAIIYIGYMQYSNTRGVPIYTLELIQYRVFR
jgi:hypothetical protein